MADSREMMMAGREPTVSKKRRWRSRRDETMRRNILISSLAPRISFGVKGEKDPEPQVGSRPWRELRGQLTEPVREARDAVLKLWSDPDKRVGPARPVAIRYITGIQPQVEVIERAVPLPSSHASGG
jgi:hypothetical protein